MTTALLPFFATVNGTDYTDRADYTAACKREGYRYVRSESANPPRQARYIPTVNKRVRPRDYSPLTKEWAAAKDMFGGALWCISAKRPSSRLRGGFYVWVVEEGQLVEYFVPAGVKK